MRTVLALGFALGLAASAAAEPAVPSAERLAQLADERGPIRQHLEEAFPPAGIDLAVAPDPSAAPAVMPQKRRKVKAGYVVLGVVVAYAALYLIAFSQGFDP